MAKLIVGIALVVFCGFCGYLLTKKYRVRKDFYKQYYTFNRDFLNEIAFSRRALDVWLEKKQFSGSFETTLGSFMIALKSGDTALETFETPDFLSEDDKLFTREYFLSLGRGDSEGQKGYFTVAEKTLTARKEAAEKDCARYCDLYVKMGVLLGLALLILLL